MEVGQRTQGFAAGSSQACRVRAPGLVTPTMPIYNLKTWPHQFRAVISLDPRVCAVDAPFSCPDRLAAMQAVRYEPLAPQHIKELRLLNSAIFPVKFHVRGSGQGCSDCACRAGVAAQQSGQRSGAAAAGGVPTAQLTSPRRYTEHGRRTKCTRMPLPAGTCRSWVRRVRASGRAALASCAQRRSLPKNTQRFGRAAGCISQSLYTRVPSTLAPAAFVDGALAGAIMCRLEAQVRRNPGVGSTSQPAG